MRLFMASLATETNAFAPFPTGRAAFEGNGVRHDASRVLEGFGAEGMAAWRARAEAEGIEVVEGLSAWAEPAGKTVRAVYEGYRDAVLDELRQAGPVDLVLLMLHGAMVADGYDDCEGDLITRARAIAPGALIGVELDPHCHLTRAMVEAADVVVAFKEYPHVDVAECAEALIDLCLRAACGQARPTPVLLDLKMVGFYPTFAPPMKGVVASLREAERRPGVLSASLAHGFPWADVADVGTRLLVYGDGDSEAAKAAALELAERLYTHRRELLPDFPGVEASLDKAAALTGRVVLGDMCDNPGGGAPSDSTFILREMLRRGVEDAALGAIFDPQAALIAAEAGAGANLQLRLGGKTSRASGDPLDLEVEVRAVTSEHAQRCFDTRVTMGLCVWLRCDGIDLVVSSRRSQVYGMDLFTGLGIDLQAKRLIVVKSSGHFEADFAPITDHTWRVASPGALNLDFEAFPYTKRDLAYFPRVPDPWATAGRPEPVALAARRAAA